MYVDLDEGPARDVDSEGGVPYPVLDKDPDWYKVEHNSDGSRKIVIKHRDMMKGNMKRVLKKELFQLSGNYIKLWNNSINRLL